MHAGRILAAIIGILAMGIAAAIFVLPNNQLRGCGHPKDMWSELSPFRATHCCSSGRTVASLRMLYTAQLLNHQDHGVYAKSFEELGNEYEVRSRGYKFYLDTGGAGWTISVPEQATLAGSYLLTSEGKIHFNAGGATTTNDAVLVNCER